MKTQIVMQVTVDVSTNENDTYLSDIEHWVACHVKNCLADNPNVNVFVNIDDVDV